MTIQLARTFSGFGALDWSVLVVGVFVAGVLIASFVWGSRRKRRDSPPTPPSHAPTAPDPDSWTTPDQAEGAGARRRRAPRRGP